jgi:hypothetical protein
MRKGYAIIWPYSFNGLAKPQERTVEIPTICVRAVDS